MHFLKNKKITEQVIAVLIAIVVISNLVVLIQYPVSEFSLKLFFFNSLNGIVIGSIMGGGIILIGNYLEKKYPWLENPVKRLVFQLVYTIGYCLAIIALTTLIMKFLLNDRISSEMLWDNTIFMVKIALGFLLGSMLLTTAIQFFVNWKKSVVLQEQLKREQLDLQYETLKNQVNPHFLFNSLNSVTSLIKKDPDKAIDFVKKLSEVLRYVLDQKDNELVTLASELEILESYIYLQKIRFGENLVVNIDVPNRSGLIIPLALQMLFENVIKHNVVSKEFPLAIDIFAKEPGYIVIKNNLKKKPVSVNSGIGLENIRSRYVFFTSSPVIINETDADFMVEIPVLANTKTG